MTPLTDDNIECIEQALTTDGADCASPQEVSAMVAEIRRYRAAVSSSSSGGDLSDAEVVDLEDSLCVAWNRHTRLGVALSSVFAELRRRRVADGA